MNFTIFNDVSDEFKNIRWFLTVSNFTRKIMKLKSYEICIIRVYIYSLMDWKFSIKFQKEYKLLKTCAIYESIFGFWYPKLNY